MKRLAIYLHPYLGRIGLGFTIKFMGTLLDLMIPQVSGMDVMEHIRMK